MNTVPYRHMIKETYKGVEITYKELSNEWLFQLGDFERKAPSLALAKKAIDKKPKFKRIPVWTTGRYGMELSEGELTSVCPDGRYGWVVFPDKSRSQINLSAVWPRNPANDMRAKQYAEKAAEVERLTKENEILLNCMDELSEFEKGDACA